MTNGHRGQHRVVGGKAGQRQVGGGRHGAEVHPRIVLAGIAAAGAAGVPDARQVLGVSGEAQPRSQHLGPQVVSVEGEGAAVVRHALGRAGEQREVVRLAGVLDGERLRHRRPRRGQGVDVGGRRVADDVRRRVVLQHQHHDVVGTRDARDGGRGGGLSPGGGRRQLRQSAEQDHDHAADQKRHPPAPHRCSLSA